ncbi:MAG: heparinase II/III family protein [Alphaproteobacteria bacterium]|nr:heparinase II/III family protein [Alphaproteobacteria bacterium]
MLDGGLFRVLREFYFRTPFSIWRLNQDRDATIIIPANDAWPGDPERGRAIIEGLVTLSGVTIAETEAPWRGLPKIAEHAEYLHGFTWLRDLRDLGGEASRSTARDLVANWISTHDSWHPITWRPDILGERLAIWLGTFDLFCASADDEFRERVMASISRQARHLARDLVAAPAGIRRLRALNGLTIASVALGAGDDRLDQVEQVLSREIQVQINADGGHNSRSPARHCEALRALIDIRGAFRARGKSGPAELDDAIDRMTMMLRLWRHGDGKLALFNQTSEAPIVQLENVIARSESRRKAATDAPDTGFQRITGGRTCVIIDTGPPSPHEASAHASPLAFELSSGKQRLIVNCGTSVADQRWQGPLRASAAHSMLMIDDHNAADVTVNGQIGARATTVSSERRHEDGASLIEAEHDGYLGRFGLIHRRRLYLSASGDDLRGEDRLTYTGAPGELPNTATLRFHLHPRVQASVVQRGASALLRPASGGGWRLRTDSGLSLNESIYFGTDTRQRCEQIVIARSLEGVREAGEITIRWALRREDGRAG